MITLEFARVEVNDSNDLANFIVNVCDDYAQKYNITLTIESYEQRFYQLVEQIKLKTGRNVVVLIDEYDKPILDNLFSDAMPAVKKVMQSFYAAVKSLDPHLHFVFITGVSKFAKVSVFSGMDNLTDISGHLAYADICGVNDAQLNEYFKEPIEDLANLEGSTTDNILAEIKHWYNGYRFHHKGISVYNPFSLLSLFRYQEFKNLSLIHI